MSTKNAEGGKFLFYLTIGLLITAIIAIAIIFYFGHILILGPIVGAIIAAGTTLSITFALNTIEKKNSKKRLVHALIAELSALKVILQSRIAQGEELLRKDDPIMTVNISEDYFTVFSNNADKLGLLNNSAKVIKTYIELKGLFDNARWISEQNRRTSLIFQELIKLKLSGRDNTAEYFGLSSQFQMRKEHAASMVPAMLIQPVKDILITIDDTIILLGKEISE